MVLGILDSVSNIRHHALSSVAMENRGDNRRIPLVASTPLGCTLNGFVCLLRKRYVLVNRELRHLVYPASQSFNNFVDPFRSPVP